MDAYGLGSPMQSPRDRSPVHFNASLRSLAESQSVAGGPVDDAEWARTLAARLEERAHSMAGSFAFAETQHALSKAEEDARQWRARAEAAESRLIDVLPKASASCTACEEMLARLAQAKNLADLSDLSRMIFEVRTAMMEIEEGSRGEAHGRGSQPRTPGGRRAGRTPSALSPPKARQQPSAGRRAANGGAAARERPAPLALPQDGPPLPPQPSTWAGQQDALAAFGYPGAGAGYAAISPGASGAGASFAGSSSPMGYHPSYSFAASPSWWQSQSLAGVSQPQLSALQAQAAQHQQLMLLQAGQHPAVRGVHGQG